jgi:hypothetical protein
LPSSKLLAANGLGLGLKSSRLAIAAKIACCCEKLVNKPRFVSATASIRVDLPIIALYLQILHHETA